MRLLLTLPLYMFLDIEIMDEGDELVYEKQAPTDERPWWKRFLGTFWYRYRRPSEEDDAFIDSLMK